MNLLLSSAAPSKPSVTLSATNFNVGDRVDLTCSVTPANSAYTYEWSKDSTVLSSQTCRVVTFTAFALADFGSYTCKVVFGSLSSPVSDAVTVAALCKLVELSLLFLLIY
jgi:hypothetical protein